MNGKQKTAAAGGGIGLTGGLLWLANIVGLDIPPDVIAGIGPIVGYLIREFTD